MIGASDDGKLKTGWVIEVEPDVQFGTDVLIPDLAGWRVENLPAVNGTDTLVKVVPDWTCEIVAPGSGRMDRVEKFRIYLESGVRHYWIIDPFNRTLEAFANESALMERIGAWGSDDKARIDPFEELEIDLGSLWLK